MRPRVPPRTRSTCALERNPKGDGRVDRIAFSASDGKGGSCSGTAKVLVPRKKGETAVDGGNTASWNSFTGAPVS
jgi:hypothetical protein